MRTANTLNASASSALEAESNPNKAADSGLEIGGVSPETRPSPPTRLVIATFNIRYAVGSFLISGSLLRRAGLGWPGRRSSLVERHIKRTAHAFTEGKVLPPIDLLALQEADRGTRRAGRRHVAHELAERMGVRYVRVSSPTPQDEPPQKNRWYLDFEEQLALGETGDTGVALLSRVSLEDEERIDLPWSDCAWRPRLAVAATTRLGDDRVKILNVHIDPHAGLSDQIAQHEALLRSAANHEGPIVLLGDFNTLSRANCSAVRAYLETRGFHTPLPTGVATWRAGVVRLHPDWIFTRDLSVRRWGVARSLRVSDHWPVWAEVERLS